MSKNFKGETIDLFIKHGFGWISPSGRLIPCSQWGHYDVIINDEEIESAIPWIHASWGGVEAAREECENLANSGEHPEWHIYEIAEDNFRYKVWEALMSAGFLRVGTSVYGKIVEIEGSRDTLSKYLNNIKDLIIEFNASKGVEYSMVFQRKDK